MRDEARRLGIAGLWFKHTHHHGDCVGARITHRRQLGQQHRHRLPTRTAARNVHLVAAGDFAHDIQSLDAAFDIFGHAPNAHVVGRVAPGNHEWLNPVVGLPFDDRFFRRQIIDIHFVDLRRNGQLWDRIDLVGGGRILDQLEPFIAIDHRAFCRCDIFAELERLFVDLAHHHIVVDHVVIGVFQALDEAKSP